MTERLLIVGPSWLGDAVMMGSLVQRLKATVPERAITVLTPAHLAGVVRRLPGVADTLVNPFAHGALKLAERAAFGRSLSGRFDAAIVLPHSWKSALVPLFARIPRRSGFVGEARYLVLNDARKLDEAALPRMVDRFCLLAEQPGVRAPGASPPPRLEVDPADVAATRVRLGLADGPAVALCIGAEYGPAKRWPARHFAELARRLAGKGIQPWLLGGPGDVAAGAEVAGLAPGAIDLTGRTNLDEAAGLIAGATAAVSNDSGLMHVAAAVGRPLVALYGSSSPTFTPPLSDRAVILSEGLPCSPCFERVCPLGHFNCLNGLSPDRVWAALRPMFARLV
ncbi:MAG TPA: lipopolysaccharide heptosyltransferase II [Caulobacteraceae bacterium]|nr:lipopolysaccharide heptosyltransferase II [Caulobacteraceae bacterium]